MGNPEVNVQVLIDYKRSGDAAWSSHPIDVCDYFEASGAPLDVDAVPRYNHGIEYLDLEPAEVSVVRVVISSTRENARRTTTETFWNGGACRIIERTDSGPRPYWEMIVESRVCDEPPSWEVLRVVRRDEALVPIYHAILRENTDGSQDERALLSESRVENET